MKFNDEQTEKLRDLADMVLDYIIPKERELYNEDVKKQPFMKDCHIFIELLKLQQMIYTGKVDKKEIPKQLKQETWY